MIGRSAATGRAGLQQFTPGAHGPVPSDSQWEVIRTVGRHLLVAAGAGTGKTFTVVQKVLYLLGVPVRGEVYEPALRLDQMAAITYTNRAAAELKEKIRAALRAAGRRAQAAEVDEARIGTIHSFCGDILREFALRRGLDPAMTVLTELESIQLASESIRSVLLATLQPPDGAVIGAGDGDLGLGVMLDRHSLRDVEKWVRQLLDQGDALPALAARVGVLPPAEATLVRLALRVRARIEERLRSDGTVDFDRMITWTRDLIRDDASVRAALQRRLRVLIIDEFQDVDPAQREIADLLGDPASGRPDTPRLVLVGDPKQSIYRFRKADVRVWRSVERDFMDRAWGRVLPLAENRRSVPGVLGFVDHTIGALLDTPAERGAGHQDFEVPYAPVVPTRTDGPWPQAVEVLAVPADTSGKAYKAGLVRASDAAAVARRACELHEQGVAWRDMAVLFTAWEALDSYEAALRAAGVPTYALRSEGFYDRPEIVDLLVALRAVRDPNDDRALVGFLRGPCVGLSDETLLRIVRQAYPPYWGGLRRVVLPDVGASGPARASADAGAGSSDGRGTASAAAVCGVASAPAAEGERLRAGIALLDRLVPLRDRMPIRALVERLLDESGYLAHLALLWGSSSQQVANVRKFLRELDGVRDVSVSHVLRAIADARMLGVEQGDARLHGEQDDVVTMTSVHMAKGLEWRVVFWCDLMHGLRSLNEKLVVSGSDVALAPAGAAEKSDPTGAFARLKAQALAERDAEAKRLWYVAATRARDLLVLGGIPLGEGGRFRESPAFVIRESLRDATLGGRACVPYAARSGVEFQALVRCVEVIEESAPAPGIGALGDPSAVPGPLPAIVVPRSRARHSATELLALERCGRKHWFTYVLGVREPEPVRRAPDSGAPADHPTAIERGLIVHDVLERYEADRELEAWIEDAIGRWDEDAPPPETPRGIRYRRSLSAELESVLADPRYRAVFDRSEARRELPFLYIREPGFYATGQIDLVAPGAGGYDVIDVKTGDCAAADASERAERYAIQRALYTAALEAIGGRPVASFAFHFSHAGVQIAALTDRGAVGAELACAVEELLADPPALTDRPVECRFCGYRGRKWCAGVASSAGAGRAAPGTTRRVAPAISPERVE